MDLLDSIIGIETNQANEVYLTRRKVARAFIIKVCIFSLEKKSDVGVLLKFCQSQIGL